MAKIGGASGALTTPSNINLQRLNAGAIKNSSPFIQTEQQTDIVFQTLNGVVASEPIDFDPKSASNSMCDNLVIEAGTQSAKFKQLLYYSSDKSREITPLTRDFLKLSKGSQAEQNQYKLGLVQLAHGVGGGRIIYDETKFPIKPQLGDSITLQAVLGDLAYPSKIIEVQQTPEIITPPEKQEGERKPEEASSPPAAPKGGGGGGTPTAASVGKSIKAVGQFAAIRPEVLANREAFFGKYSKISFAEFRWILEPEIRKVADQNFPPDQNTKDRWIAQTLIWSWNETGGALQAKNQYFGQPYRGGKYGEEKITVQSDCKRVDRSDKCYCTSANEWNQYCDDSRKKEQKLYEGKNWFSWLKKRNSINSKENPEEYKKINKILEGLVTRSSAPFHYGAWSSVRASIESHYQFHKSLVLNLSSDAEYFQKFDSSGVYNKDKLTGYKSLIQYMNLEVKNDSIYATKESYEELKKDNEQRKYLNRKNPFL